ncbi:MAG: glycosyltransferase involved in cell wall biosynthesis [Planctomycetota bacterium]|jgi:glycosyltransferase involved in cell wall biosynthesis
MTRHVLATAYACQPGVGSEPGIGWHWAREIAKHNRLTLITRENNVLAIERAAEKLKLPMTVVGFDLPKWKRSFKKDGRGAVPYFAMWQKGLEPLAREIHAINPVDVTHHLTFASSWIGSGLSHLKLPFVWGPVGQHHRVPDDAILGSDLSFRAREVCKTRVRGAGSHTPLLQSTLENSDVILSRGQEFQKRIPLEYQYKTVHMLAAGVDSFDFKSLDFERGRILEIVFAGRLTDLKGVRLAMEAFGKLRYRQPLTRLTFIGDGDRRRWLQNRTADLGLGDAVRILGQISQKKVFEYMRAADMLLSPSFEGGGMVVLEAMASGLPVVCLDRGGPGEIVAHNNGISVPYRGFDDAAETLAMAMEIMVKDEKLRQHVGKNGAKWVQHTATWDAKSNDLEWIYNQATEHFWRVKRLQNPDEADPATVEQSDAA